MRQADFYERKLQFLSERVLTFDIIFDWRVNAFDVLVSGVGGIFVTILRN